MYIFFQSLKHLLLTLVHGLLNYLNSLCFTKRSLLLDIMIYPCMVVCLRFVAYSNSIFSLIICHFKNFSSKDMNPCNRLISFKYRYMVTSCIQFHFKTIIPLSVLSNHFTFLFQRV